MTTTQKFMQETELTADNCMKNALGFDDVIKKSSWRLITDEPPFGEDVLVFSDNRIVIAVYDGKYWLTDTDASIEYDYQYPFIEAKKIAPTHWMTLPSPPTR